MFILTNFALDVENADKMLPRILSFDPKSQQKAPCSSEYELQTLNLRLFNWPVVYVQHLWRHCRSLLQRVLWSKAATSNWWSSPETPVPASPSHSGGCLFYSEETSPSWSIYCVWSWVHSPGTPPSSVDLAPAWSRDWCSRESAVVGDFGNTILGKACNNWQRNQHLK